LSFSGGGGSTGVSAHVHSNVLGEGGSLAVPDTLIQDRSLSSYIIAMG
jgi:hypothetical protein